jgi:type VI secretion system protein ImpA
MASPPVLDIEALLVPVSEDRPSGLSLAYDPEYDAIREARRSDDDTPQGDWQRKTKSAQWDRVVALGTSLLKDKTKDLQIAAWVAEALTRLHGFAGLRDGLALIRAIQDRFWDSYFPEIEDGDVESRSGPFLFLDATLPLVIRGIPLTAGLAEKGYSFLRWEESRATENFALKDPDLLEARMAEGKLTAKQFDDEVAQTPRRFYESLREDLLGSLDALKELDRSVDEHFGRDAPGLVNIRKAVEDCRRPLEPILSAKRMEEPDPEDEAEVAGPESGGDDWSSTDPEASDSDGREAPRPARRPAAPRASGGPIASVEDAFRRVVEAAAYLRKNEPASPVPFLVVRALRLGELYVTPDPANAEAPSSETRQSLRRLAAEGAWEELLEGAEGALGRPEGRAWLDPHRFAILAIEGSGEADRSAAAEAVRNHLRATLAAFPGLIEGELGDGTPTASGDTRAWLRESILPPPADPGPDYATRPMPASTADADGEPEVDVMDQAIAAVRAGRSGEGLELIRRAMKSAQSGRDRFLRKLQMAELCLMVNNARLALPLAEDLSRQVDAFHLEEWEEERLSARVWSVLYRCLQAGDGQAERGRRRGAAPAARPRAPFARLCRLDIGQALAYGGEDAPSR